MYYKTNIFPLPEVISVYEIIRQTVWRCADEQNIIVLILDGSCSFAIANVSHSLSVGDMILIPAGQEYIRRPVNNTLCRMAYIHFKTAVPIDHISIEKESKGSFFMLYPPQIVGRCGRWCSFPKR